jgi:hypothetical protein
MLAKLSHVLPFLTVHPCVGCDSLRIRGLWQHGEICVFLSKLLVVSSGLHSI